MCKIESHEGVTGFEHSQQYGCVGLCARVGLYVGIFGSEQLAHTVDGELLHLVHYLATAIVSLAGIALGILVGQA